jgi:hypothetical protein
MQSDAPQHCVLTPTRVPVALLAAVPLQRFRCFGDLDAPDWILAEISVLAKVSSVRMKLIVSQVGLPYL